MQPPYDMPPARHKLLVWLTKPETPEDAWKVLPYKIIGEQAGISEYAVRTNLPMLVEELHGIPAIDCRKMRNEYAAQVKSNVKTISWGTWIGIVNDIEYRDKSFYDIATEYKISYNAVVKYYEEQKKEREEKIKSEQERNSQGLY